MANRLLGALGSPLMGGFRQGFSSNAQELVAAMQQLEAQKQSIAEQKQREELMAQKRSQAQLENNLKIWDALTKAGMTPEAKQGLKRKLIDPHIDNVLDHIEDPETIDQAINILRQSSKLGPENTYKALEVMGLTNVRPTEREMPEQMAGTQPGLEFAAEAGKGEQAYAPITIVNKVTGEKQLVIPSFDTQTGKAKVTRADLPAGFEISKETDEEKRQAEVLAAREKEIQKETGKGIAARTSSAIEKGVNAAEGYANLVRARTLLDTVKTGGIDAAKLRAKQLFGVEAADEAELSNKLSKAVLSQLKATFGAQFTVEEGKRLERIEAGFGKSTEGNKRLLEQTMEIVKRSAERGIRAARRAGDEDTVQDIEELLQFTLESQPSASKANTIGRFTVKVK